MAGPPAVGSRFTHILSECTGLLKCKERSVIVDIVNLDERNDNAPLYDLGLLFKSWFFKTPLESIVRFSQRTLLLFFLNDQSSLIHYPQPVINGIVRALEASFAGPKTESARTVMIRLIKKAAGDNPRNSALVDVSKVENTEALLRQFGIWLDGRYGLGGAVSTVPHTLLLWFLWEIVTMRGGGDVNDFIEVSDDLIAHLEWDLLEPLSLTGTPPCMLLPQLYSDGFENLTS